MKKLSFYLLLSCAILSTTVVNAQKIALGVRGGVSIPNLTTGGDVTNPLNDGYKSRFGPDFAVFAEFKVSKMFSLQPMIEYSAQGGKKTGIQAFPTPASTAAMFPPGYAPTYLYAKYDNTAKLNYLMIPILAKFGWNLGSASPVRLYVNAGPFVSLLVSAHQVLEGTSPIYMDAEGQQVLDPTETKFDHNLDIKQNLRRANFGVQANVGVSYTIKRSSIFVEGGFNYGFVNIQKDAANGQNQTGAATASIGYAYWFGK